MIMALQNSGISRGFNERLPPAYDARVKFEMKFLRLTLLKDTGWVCFGIYYVLPGIGCILDSYWIVDFNSSQCV